MNRQETENNQLPTVLVTGAKGQLGNKIIELLSDKMDIILTDTEEMDITNKLQVHNAIKLSKPDYIIHCAAYTRVDDAEENKELCFKINAGGTGNIAEAAKKYGSTLFYISTDYVFDGNKNSPYDERDLPSPLSVYGQSKQEGEKIIEEACEKYYILRVAWLFGELPKNHPGSNFVETMIRLSKERSELNIVSDQIGSPTYTGDLVDTMSKMIAKNAPFGTYHFSGSNPCSWYDFAKEIFKLKKVKVKVNPITSAEYPQKAQRPQYSYLSKRKIEETLGIKVRPWQEMLEEYLK